MPSQLQPDPWQSGAAYEPYVGRWSRAIAKEFLPWLDVPAGRRWLDVGCGTGALTETVLATSAPASVLGIDRSDEFVAYARAHVQDSRADFQTGDAMALPVDDGQYDAVVSALALNFFPDPPAAVKELARAARPGAVVAAYVWDYAGRTQFLRHFWNAAAALDQRAVELDEGRRFPLCQPAALRDVFEQAGLRDVRTRAVDIDTLFRDFDDFWVPFLGGQGPAPGFLKSLTDSQCARLRDRLRESLPVAVGGSIPLVARAWAVRGYRR